MSDDDEVIVLCARITTPLYIPDNRIGRCSECGWKVQFRPHAPRGRRVCMKCAVMLIEDGATMKTSPRMLEDLQTYYRKKLQ
jgi:hypothetical protein